MTSPQEKRHISYRKIAGTAGQYNEDIAAAATAFTGTSGLSVNGMEMELLSTITGSSEDSIGSQQAAYAAVVGIDTWSAVDSLPHLAYDFSQLTTLPSAITYTGGVNGTKYDSDGVLGYAPHNMLLYSNTFSDGTWSKNAITESSSTLIESAVTNIHWAGQSVSLLSGFVYTYSIDMKFNTDTWMQLLGGSTSWSGNFFANFDIVNGTVGTTGSNVDSATITEVEDGYFRCTISGTCVNTGSSNAYALAFSNNLNTTRLPNYAGSTSSKTDVRKAQINIGSTALTYVPTTTAAVWTARFDHDIAPRTNNIRNNTMQGAVASVLSNLLKYSQDFGTTWFTTRSTNAQAQGTAPDGTNTANTLIEDGTAGTHQVNQPISNTGALTYSVYAKANTRTQMRLSSWNSTDGTVASAYFDLSSGSVISGTGVVTGVGDGWYRCSITGTNTATTYFYIELAVSGAASYSGDGTSSIYIWGAQINEGGLATYVKTEGSAIAQDDGTAPTNWAVSTGGATVELVGTGIEDGIEYIDYRFSGTPTSDPIISFDTTTGINALTGETWTISSAAALLAGDDTNINGLVFRQQERTESGVAVKTNQDNTNIYDSLTASLQRVSYTVALSGGATTAHAFPQLFINWDGSGAIDITLRVGLPQMERASAATPVIKTYGGAVTVDPIYWRGRCHSSCRLLYIHRAGGWRFNF